MKISLKLQPNDSLVHIFGLWGLWEEFLPLFIRTPSFTTRGIDEDEAEDDTDFGTDVDIGAEDAAEERGFTLVGAT